MATIVGASSAIELLRAQIARAAVSREPVLILGETGTGKELVARSIHDQSRRGQFVPIDCGALPETLLSSELFGYTAGAFTSARGSKPGLLEVAHGGTAFFDEIGELKSSGQAQLLRVLETKEVRRLGSVSGSRTDFRIIAATNRDLKAEVAKGDFREDLYYRLNILRIRVPPLRHRREDIPCLVEYLLSTRASGVKISSPALDTLQAYPWPGNVRELQNVILRMVAERASDVLGTDDVPVTMRMRQTESGDIWRLAQSVKESTEVSCVREPSVSFRENEVKLIRIALRQCEGNRDKAATLLGISRTTLYRKIKEHLGGKKVSA